MNPALPENKVDAATIAKCILTYITSVRKSTHRSWKLSNWITHNWPKLQRFQDLGLANTSE
jgi:hypothetical protein